MAGRGTRGRPALPRDVPEPSTPGGASPQGGRGQQHAAPVGQAVLPPPPELGGLLQAIPGLVQALQLQAQTQAAMMAHIQTGMAAPAANQERVAELEHVHGASMMERFRRMGPPSFKGESSPDVAEGWIRETEKIFRAIRCPEEDKVPLATYTLQDRADVWWTSTLRTVFPGRNDIAWEEFLQVFRERFFPVHVQEKLELGFLTLTQGSLSVMDYEARFVELEKFAPHICGSEQRRAAKFVRGLKAYIRSRVIVQDHQTLGSA